MVNPALVAMFRYPDKKTLLSTRATDLYDQMDPQSGLADLLADGPAPTVFRTRMRRHDGASIWIRVSVSAVTRHGELLYYEGSVEDVTKQKEAEDEIHQRAGQLEALNQVIAAAVAASNLEELLDTALHEILRVLGLEMGAIWAGELAMAQGMPFPVGRSLAQAGLDGDLDLPGIVAVDDWDELDAGIGTEKPAELTELGIEASLTAPIMASGRAVGGISLADSKPRGWTAHELTFVEVIGRQLGTAAERLRLVETIREQVLRLHQILHTVPEGVLLLDAERHVILANPIAREHLETLAEAQTGDILLEIAGTELDMFLESTGGHRHEVEVDSQAYEVVVQAIESDEGRQGWVLLTRDVTEERALQRRIEQRDRLAAVGQLAAGIAHDFSNIMAVVLLYAQMAVREPKTPAKTRERLEVISDQARRATDLIQQILDFSRNTLLERQRIDLVPFLKETIRLLERTLPSDILVDFAYGMGQHVVSADPTRVQQLLMNLALNARDAMPRGGNLNVRLERVAVGDGQGDLLPELVPGEWIRLSVSDTGEGIAPDVLPRIFEPFFTTKAPGHGSGLGLAQVYGIVEQHHGVIDVTSDQGRGTTFTIYLPALPLSTPQLERHAGQDELAMGNKETVLVVEDSSAARGALVESLVQLDYRVVEARNGREALDTMTQNGREIDLVLTDVVMPQMGGLAFLDALSTAGWDGPTIVLSGHPLDDLVQERLTRNGTIFLEKPVDLAGLADGLRCLLRPVALSVHEVCPT
jgi:signal transduction histidine kinase